MEKSIIKIKSMSYKDNNNYIFKDFDLDIKPNSFVCIIGKNGSGKSTLIKILSGINKASGYINVDGYLLNNFYIKYIRRIMSVCTSDIDNIFIGETVKDDLAFSLENLCYSKKEIDNSINNFAKKFKLDNVLEINPNDISASEKVKLFIASSLIHNPKILILDNSIHRLNSSDKKLVLKILDEYRKKNKLTIILITNDLEDTLLSDRIIVLDNGKIILDGSKEEIYKDDKLERMGYSLPFMVKLSHNLMLYGLLDKVYFDDMGAIDKLWE